MEAPHSKKCLVGGTQLQSNVIASSLSHYPRCQTHNSHHMKSNSGSCLRERKKHEVYLPCKEKFAYSTERISRGSELPMCRRLLKNRNVLNYHHSVSLLIALSFSQYYITYETQRRSKERGGDAHRMGEYFGWLFNQGQPIYGT